jgi:hypothetical protein
MKKKTAKKLFLSRETLRSLSNSTLGFVAGGDPTFTCTGTRFCPFSGPDGWTCVTYPEETCAPTHTDCQ